MTTDKIAKKRSTLLSNKGRAFRIKQSIKVDIPEYRNIEGARQPVRLAGG
jgi:hypothetical protein